MITHISQSFMKDMEDYLAGEQCGHIIKHKYVDQKELPGSDTMAIGAYFEFLVSGALPKNKVIPTPIYMASAKGMEVRDMEQGYRRAHFNAKYVTELLGTMGLKIIGVQKKLTKGRHQGTLDLICEAQKDIDIGEVHLKKGDRIVIDLKYSGLINDKWSKHGWMWMPEQRSYHGKQAMKYHYISELDFYFLVCQSNNEELDKNKNLFKKPEVRFFKVNIGEEALEQHLALSNQLWDQFILDAELGFSVKPSLTRCNKCPLAEGCNDKFTYPRAETIEF